MLGQGNLTDLILRVMAIVLGLTVHEYWHARMAYILGDHTAKNDGRLTLNPIKHIDVFGFILLLIAGFGWAKPVMFNPNNLKKPRRDEMLIALAGPVSNLVVGFLLMVVLKLIIVLFPHFSVMGNDTFIPFVVRFIFLVVQINIVLFVFNMIPIPPLDGSHLLFRGFIKNERFIYNAYKYGTWVLIGIIILQQQMHVEILPIGRGVQFIVESCFNLLGIQ